MKINYLDFDIYSKRIGLYYHKKERMSSNFGFILTLLYITASLSLFWVYTYDVIKHKTIRVNDSTIYPREAPSISLDNNLFYFAFGVETAIDTNKFVDNTIYYPRVHFYYKKKEDGNLKTIYEEELKVERCNETKFGEDYQSLLVSGELNNSHCIEDINLTLIGGAKYDRISYIGIGIYPCVNTTENHNHCKPQEVIDYYMSGAYFYVFAKDIGLNPSNFDNPLIPTFYDLYTTIDKSFFRDLIMYFGITEIQTDEGLFGEKITLKKILQFRRESKSFYFRDQSKYYEGKTMCNIQFRLGEDIRIQKRSYNKITGVFSTIGGYMQMISTVFTIITMLTNKLQFEMKLFNSLYDYLPERRKISLKNELKLIDFLSNNYYRSIVNNKTEIHNDSNNKIINFSINNGSSFEKDNHLSKKKDKYSNKIIINKNKSTKIFAFNNNSNNKLNSFMEKNKLNNTINKNSINEDNKSINKSNMVFLPYGIGFSSSLNLNQQNIINKSIGLSQNDYILHKNTETSDNYSSKEYNINMFSYLFSKCKKKREIYKLFDIGISFYRKKVDVINLFNIVILIEKLTSNS